MTTRIEHDLLGERALPADAWYGIQTQRALDNFRTTGIPISHFPELVQALAMVKSAAARANQELGVLELRKAEAIQAACSDIRAGALNDQFVVDLIQGGAGTSTNMNANEVIANLALAKLGHPKGAYKHLHPNDDVNRSQSTNDAYLTAACLSLQFAAQPLTEAIGTLGDALQEKAVTFTDVIKMGRTQLQDAVPMTLGQEFEAFAVNLGEDIDRLREAQQLLCEINLGGTAIGTGLNAPAHYQALAVEHLAQLSGRPLVPASHLIEATSDMGAFVFLSGVLKRFAIKLGKLCNDLRLLSSGPRTGLGEITLPPVQPGSSIMPGKVNPVIPEAVNQTAYQVIASDLAVTMAAEAGQLQLNAMEPMIVYNLLNAMRMLEEACHMLCSRCIKGIEANRETCARHVERSIGVVTALVPHIGYANATRIARQALQSNATIRELVIAEELLDPQRLDALLTPQAMLAPMTEA
ncbi:aspartate ammonia-lyase [Aidingimonas lacisalsi]|uniref:aspartate ammonia-lyase n=1 Tax=Aidingimonas lacisalsi TaxID=2604086 RepID=UPI0011D27F74|nr:aspartate ammonia-lyase [Aidingimonas lacisalsi]